MKKLGKEQTGIRRIVAPGLVEHIPIKVAKEEEQLITGVLTDMHRSQRRRVVGLTVVLALIPLYFYFVLSFLSFLPKILRYWIV